MPLTMIDRNGPPEAIICPSIVCDSCGAPINATEGGLALWQPNREPDGRPSPVTLRLVHQGRCDQFAERRWGHHYSQDLKQFMAPLAYNYATPFTLEPDVDYVAPAPSIWRQSTESQAGPAHEYGDD